jgi:aminoglycoside 2''-phosphotransferase
MEYHMLPGEPLWPKTLHALKDEQLLQHLADQLATFLHRLHATPTEALKVKLPDFRGCDEWQELYERFRDKLFPSYFLRKVGCNNSQVLVVGAV